MRGIDFEQLRLLSANTLDNRRNCRHNHMLDGEAVPNRAFRRTIQIDEA